MLQNLFSLRQFRLIKWSFFVHSTTRNAPYVHQRLDSIVELCRTFPIDHMCGSHNNTNHSSGNHGNSSFNCFNLWQAYENGPPSAHLNGASLVGRRWPDEWDVSLLFDESLIMSHSGCTITRVA